MLSLFRYLSGYLEVMLSGRGAERFLNLCSRHEILIWDLRKEQEVCFFKLSVRSFRRIRPYVRKTGITIRIQNRYGLPFWLYRYKKRKLFFAGILLAASLLIYLSQFVWNIEITGNSRVTEDTLLHFLEENSWGYGSSKKSLDCEAMEAALRESFPDIIWTSIELSGTKMTVAVKESLLSRTESEPDSGEPTDLIAGNDGIVTSIVTRSGTPCVKAGDVVAQGDVLVYGRIDIYDDDGNVVDCHYCTADADVYLQEEELYTDEISAHYLQKEKTGNRKICYTLELFGKCVPLFAKACGYEQYELTSEYRQWRLYQNYYFPVILRIDTYEEYDETQAVYTRERMKEQAKEHFAIYLDELAKKNIQILEKNVMINTGKEGLTVSGTLTVVKKAGQRQSTDRLESEENIENSETTQTNERLAADEME